MQQKILLIEICNYDDYPIGGYLAFAKQMVTAFKDDLALVGLSTDNTPVGRWTKKEIDGINFDFFSVRKVVKTNRRTLIPGRLKSYWSVRKYKKEIFVKDFAKVFVQTPEVLFALDRQKIPELFTRIPGVENPMMISRYWYGKYFSYLFDIMFFKSLNRSKLIFASANREAIHNFIYRDKKCRLEGRVIQFPTRVDTKIFHPIPKLLARHHLQLSEEKIIITTTGRLSKLKGWELMLESFMVLRKDFPNAFFMFLGDGEDRKTIEEFIQNNDLEGNVFLAGRLDHRMLALYLNASDVFVMGSFIEGWATSLMEAIACAKPIVATNFSSAKELIEQGKNGFVLENRNANEFSNGILKALELPDSNLLKKVEDIQIYSTSNLRVSLEQYFDS
ncbi:glycosyltransferase [Algoriphagus marinus]|uniref:glycosyltransferase n=1 Tax=Algoriphagus marinus TaxID=1925762 RepID=UPI00094BB6A4|nr:glycosyltransferase [Algoriphagus marinus]